MKVPPKRKGNPPPVWGWATSCSLNESPSEKEGKWWPAKTVDVLADPLNESPSEKEGKFVIQLACCHVPLPSMKVPPKRKGNPGVAWAVGLPAISLNESPSEKEGKSSRSRPNRTRGADPQ